MKLHVTCFLLGGRLYSDIKEAMIKYQAQDPWDIVDLFESRVAEYAGSKYAVSVDNCTNALFLCLKYLKAEGEIEIPCKTYLSVPGLIIHAGCKPVFKDFEWTGLYQLNPYPIVDSATRFTKGMYLQDTYQCLSFHIRKILPIAKGGMILTNDLEAVKWFKQARYEGRNERVPHDLMDEPTVLGWNMYMPPEQAARGLEIFESLPEVNKDSGGSWKYKDLSKYKIFEV